MDTQQEIVAIATRLRGPQHPEAERLYRTKAQSTYALALEGMNPEMLALFQQRLKDQVLKAKGDMNKVYMKISDKEIVWTTGFHSSNSLFVSVGNNKEGKKCLTFDAYLTDEEIREIQQSNTKKTVSPSLETKAVAKDATAGIQPEDAGF